MANKTYYRTKITTFTSMLSHFEDFTGKVIEEYEDDKFTDHEEVKALDIKTTDGSFYTLYYTQYLTEDDFEGYFTITDIATVKEVK